MTDGYLEKVKKLPAFETFDAGVFIGNQEWPQPLCNFILTLSLIYNDFADIDMGLILLNRVVPTHNDIATREVGYHRGVGLHLMKLLAGLLHEFLKTIDEEKKVVRSPEFMRLKKTLPKDVKKLWDEIVDVALGTKTDTTTILGFARNKVSFHYDTKHVGISFRELYQDKVSKIPPLVSRGNSLSTTRFYFADAVCERAIHRHGTQAATSLFTGQDPMINKVNFCLFHLITRFIGLRSSWKKFAEELPSGSR